MTLKEAEKTIKNNQNLIGKQYKGQEITNLIVVPINGDKFAEIITELNFGYNYTGLLAGYDKFEIIVLLDFDQYPNTGYTDWETRNSSKYSNLNN